MKIRNEDGSLDKRKFLLILGTVLLFIAVAFAGVHFARVSNEHKALSDARERIAAVEGSHGDIAPLNASIRDFSGTKIKSANNAQKSLWDGSHEEKAAVFRFTNGKQSDSRKIVDLYIDFGAPKSRDFLLLNQGTFKTMTENGLLQLNIHPVPSNDPLSSYYPEAISEAIYTSPKVSWDFLINLTRESGNISGLSNDSKIVDAIIDVAKKSGVTGVDKVSIKNGTFASWVLAGANDDRLKTGYYPPIIYVNGALVAEDKFEKALSDAS